MFLTGENKFREVKAMDRCDFCFREKPGIAPLFPKRKAPQVCKGCRYELDRAIGFLEHSGVAIDYQLALSSDTPPIPPKPIRKALKEPNQSSTT